LTLGQPMYRLMESGVLCRSDVERSRLLDMSRRLDVANRRVSVLWAVFGFFAVPIYGPLTLVPLMVACVVTLLALHLASHSRRPEVPLIAAWTAVTLCIAGAMVLSHQGPDLPLAAHGGGRFYLLMVFMLPVFAASVTYPVRVVAVGTGLTVVLMVALAFAIDSQLVLSIPATLVMPVVLVISIAMLGVVSAAADAASRTTAVVDQLTGVLNRTALEARVVELAHQVTAAGSRVAVLVGDLDGFKAINDEHGHAVGDKVLREVATRLQDALDGGETVYRFGGEEFIVLLPGLDARAASTVAERLRTEISRRPIEGLRLTISFGVTASIAGEPFDYRAAFGYADAALYDAKDAGRDRVCVRDPRHGPLAARDQRSRRGGSPPIGEGAAAAHLDAWDGHLARERSEVGSLLVDSTAEREHMLDVTDRIGRMRELTGVLVLIAMLTAVPTIGWLPLIPVIVFGGSFNYICKKAPDMQRPEYALLIGLCAAQLGYGLNFVLTPVDLIVTLAILALPVASAATVYPPRSTLIASVVTGATMVAVAFICSPHDIIANPVLLACPIAILGSTTLIGAALGRSAVDHRSASIVDPLTGMLSRVALEARIAELSHRAATSGETVSLIVGDIDHFKAINDHSGHAVGDVALKDIAGRLVDQLRAFEPAYRIGGEEFLIVLSGVDIEGARVMAERLRAAVGEVTVEGRPVTMSFGVSGSLPGQSFNYTEAFARADEALYEAKASGRNRVCVRGVSAGETPPRELVAA
jgi:diguanylate cyclase (GGDEF)-like protein